MVMTAAVWHGTAFAAVRDLPVPVSTILPGQVIAAEQLTQRAFRTSPQSLVGIATEPEQIVGLAARRRLQAGKPVPLRGLGQPVMVKRNAPLMATYEEEGFTISTPVLALADGAAGDVINARATATGAVLKVRVLPDGGVEVVGP